MLNELERPSLQISLDVDIPNIAPLEHNLGKVEEFANKLANFYDAAIENCNGVYDIPMVKAERTKVRKVIKTIEDNRKNIVKAYKEPISDFEETSKRIEKILGSTDEKLKEIVDASKKVEDPFGLDDVPTTYTVKMICTQEEYKTVLNYIKKKGIELK